MMMEDGRRGWGRWVAKLVGDGWLGWGIWVAKVDGWLSWLSA
jgi:hypothetical protein